MQEFKRRYPYADFHKFYIDQDNSGRIGVFTSSAGNLGMISVDDPQFRNSRWYDTLLFKHDIANMTDFKRKYPNASYSKFYVDSSNGQLGVFTSSAGSLGMIRASDPKFLESKYSNDLLGLTKKVPKEGTSLWPKIWDGGGNIPKMSHLIHANYQKYYDANQKTTFQHPVPMDLSNFKVYVSKTKYFMSDLPKVSERWSTGKKLVVKMNDIRKVPFDYKKEPYFAMLCGAYVASFLCGISKRNLDDDPKVFPVVTSIVRFHLYLWIQRFIKQPKLLDRFSSKFGDLRKHIPIKHKFFEADKRDGDGNQYQALGTIEYSASDWRSVIPYDSNGLTSLGVKMLQESAEVYVYCVLGAQVNTRWTIVDSSKFANSNGSSFNGRSSQTQDSFRRLVSDSVVETNGDKYITMMRKAVQDTFAVLNLAITPGMILVPSRLILLEKPIPGYNNTLHTAESKNMDFGFNDSINRVKDVPLKDVPSFHLAEGKGRREGTSLQDNEVDDKESEIDSEVDDSEVKTVKEVQLPKVQPPDEVDNTMSAAISLGIALASFAVFKFI